MQEQGSCGDGDRAVGVEEGRQGGEQLPLVALLEITVVELKYPRDSRTVFSPDTMTLGELVRDIRRVAAVPAEQGWVVQVLNPRLGRYLATLAGRYQLHWALHEGEALELDPQVLAGLPGTATAAIGGRSTDDGHCALRCGGIRGRWVDNVRLLA